MLTTTALFFCLLQAGAGAAPDASRPAGACEWCAAEVHPKEMNFEQQDFLRRFSGLATALSDFAHTYNSRGVVDVRKVKAIRKALREIEKSEWFNQKDGHRESR
jgi:hypothetical protein